MEDYMPVVSIVTPIFNSELFLEETINSVLCQTFKNWELILVDDNSSDNSRKIAEKFTRKDKRVRLIKLEKNQGPAVARNYGIHNSKGKYVAFIDSDDLWSENKLMDQIKFMKSNNYLFTFSQYTKINENGEILSYVRVPDKVSYFDLLKKNHIGCLTVMLNIEKLGEIEMPLIRKRQDLGLWLKILKKIDYAYSLNQNLGSYRIRKNSVSSNKIISSLYTWELYRKFERLSFLKSFYYFTCYAFNGLIRRLQK